MLTFFLINMYLFIPTPHIYNMQVDHVILYDFPQEPSEYLRRVGRTGRAGRRGTVYMYLYFILMTWCDCICSIFADFF